MTRVSGHTLTSEGAAYRVFGDSQYPKRVQWNTTSGTGFALCSCGARSPILDSANLRKAWHRSHKAEVTSSGSGSA